jgi:hypothetical protein
MVLATLSCAAVAYVAYVIWPRWKEPAPDAPAFPITIGGVEFNVPPAAVRVPLQRRPGAHERIDLAFLWPSLDPPNLNSKALIAEAPDAMKTSALGIERVFVTITAVADVLAPADRVRTIYPRYATAVPVAGPNGLAVLAFREGTPYQNEDLIYDAVEPQNFLVRCTRDGAGPTPGICLYEQRIAGADLVMRFPREWLGEWRPVAARLEELIMRLRTVRR